MQSFRHCDTSKSELRIATLLSLVRVMLVEFVTGTSTCDSLALATNARPEEAPRHCNQTFLIISGRPLWNGIRVGPELGARELGIDQPTPLVGQSRTGVNGEKPGEERKGKTDNGT